MDSWYSDCGRSLPWRGIEDPYRIWLSEIILQQTRVEQGRDYYHRFLDAFPTVEALAAAEEEQVLRLWQGLGYYSRARNMHAAARYIIEQCGGRFPSTYEGIRALKGVGRYTAAAIASFAFRLPYPVVDGNVYRFISRLHNITTPIGTDAAYGEFEALLLKQMDRRRPDRFNAALMDFGALQCTPRPDCGGCPFADECAALRLGVVEQRPVKMLKVSPKDCWMLYLDLRWREAGREFTVMHPREGKGIWRGLWQFPLLEWQEEPSRRCLAETATEHLGEAFGVAEPRFLPPQEALHKLTHRTLHACFFRAELPSAPPLLPPNMHIVEVDRINNIPLPRLIDRYLRGL
ncbi:MAG: A/G-specific adenine glycosylase [Bacteroidales bacterium]|nr:A/G-specific adenine glycosylase [Bacteroidales bacterium]